MQADELKAGQTLVFSEKSGIALVTMLLKQSTTDFNAYGKDYLQYLRKGIPPLGKDIDLLMQRLREEKGELKQEKQRQSSKIIRCAIAKQHLDSIHDLYQSFDQQYQNLWAHGSLLPFEVSEASLTSLNDIAQKIERAYKALASLKTKGSYADNVGNIVNLSGSLKMGIAQFFSKVREVNYQISKLRREYYKANLQSPTAESEIFIEFKPSLKAQSLAKIKQKELEAKARGETVISKQQRRKQNRTPLNQAFLRNRVKRICRC